MNILKYASKIPGGLMIIPLLLGATINTLFPQVLEIGGFTQAAFKDGANAVIGVYLFIMGSQLTVRSTGPVLQKGFAILLGKIAAGVAVGLAVGFFAPDGTLWTLTPLAIIAAMINSNGGLFAALTTEFGNKTDRGTFPIIALNDGPFFTLVVLGAAGMADVPLIALVSVIVPILLGFLLGNLDERIRDFLKPGESLLIPFFAFPLGAGIDFKDIVSAGPPGVLLGVLTVVLSGGGAMLFLHIIHRVKRTPKERRNLISGAAESSTAGNAVATPAVVATVDPSYADIAAVATTQVAGAMVTTAILTPILTTLVYRWQMKRGIDPKNEYPEYDSIGQATPATEPVNSDET
ncbi:2-keto-3-deoxygluconate permease [Brevibacterium sp. H602]|uniref:2-keto-3-deoxygluconate permease n=1 Tax=unclassified Brevibacterium TaxID=2614124 RepID=UPI0039798186